MPIPYRPEALPINRCRHMGTWGIDSRFRELFPSRGQVAYALRTRPPLSPPRRGNTVRLACIRPAASVHPEPGSNSPLYGCLWPPKGGMFPSRGKLPSPNTSMNGPPAVAGEMRPKRPKNKKPKRFWERKGEENSSIGKHLN